MKPLVIANWKMNPDTPGRAVMFARAIERGLRGIGGVEAVIAPPFPFLIPVGSVLRKAQLGAQDAFWETRGAYTGAVSAHQLKHLGVRYCIIGHSERRRLFGETNEAVNHKIKALLREGIRPVLAVGEGLEAAGEVVPDEIRRKMAEGLRGIAKSRLSEIAVAYEPEWAIGTGQPETSDNATRRAIYVRKLLALIAGPRIAASIPILYGGSVTAGNAAAFLSRDIRGMDGLLVGGSSLHAEEFVRIAQAVARRR